MSRLAWLVLVILMSTAAPRALAQAADVVAVGSAAALPGAAVNVPVFIRDVSGTPLGIDQPPGSRIQSYAISVGYAPAAAVQSVSFTRAGITAPLTPTFEASPAAPGSIALLDTFQESTNLIPFTSNAAAPGNQIGVLHVVLASSAAPGSTIALTPDPTLTQLASESGQITETVALATLALVSGSITVQQPPPSSIPMLSPWTLALLAAALVAIGLRAGRRTKD